MRLVHANQDAMAAHPLALTDAPLFYHVTFSTPYFTYTVYTCPHLHAVSLFVFSIAHDKPQSANVKWKIPETTMHTF